MLFNNFNKVWTTKLTSLSLILSLFPGNTAFLKECYLQCDLEIIKISPSPPMPGCCKGRKVMCEEKSFTTSHLTEFYFLNDKMT